MALSDMKVFNQYLQEATIETIAQMVEAFNAASAGAIVLDTRGFDGDFLMQSMFSSLHSAQRRVDRYATNTSAAETSLAQIQHNSVKVAGGFGPIAWEPAQLTWVQQRPEVAIEVISRNMAEAMMSDMLNTAIVALVTAIEAQSSAKYDTGTGPMAYSDINSAHALFGDRSSAIVLDVMDGALYHSLIGQNLTNQATLFNAQNVTVVEVLGKRILVTDATALRETGTLRDVKVLGLVQGAAMVHDAGDLLTNVETSNGSQRIKTTFQADYTFGIGLKGYAWDTTSGGKSPDATDLSTAANWDKIATSIKDTAGVIALADAP